MYIHSKSAWFSDRSGWACSDGLKGGRGTGSDFSMLINVSSVCWLVSKFAEKRIFESLYKMLIRFVYTVGLALLGTVGLFMARA